MGRGSSPPGLYDPLTRDAGHEDLLLLLGRVVLPPSVIPDEAGLPRYGDPVHRDLGPLFPLEESAEVRGRDLLTGLPKTVVVTGEEIREAIGPAVEAIVGAAKDTLDRTPPELASDIIGRGMVLAGGGALLRDLDERLRRETGVAVHVAEDPLRCVAVGSGRYLEEIGVLGRALSPS